MWNHLGMDINCIFHFQQILNHASKIFLKIEGRVTGKQIENLSWILWDCHFAIKIKPFSNLLIANDNVLNKFLLNLSFFTRISPEIYFTKFLTTAAPLINASHVSLVATRPGYRGMLAARGVHDAENSI